VATLRRLADALEAESAFTIQVAGERLRVPADVAFTIEHERANGVDELKFQVRWSASGRVPPKMTRAYRDRRPSTRRATNQVAKSSSNASAVYSEKESTNAIGCSSHV
jgi:amphi-Trp domain-containing protein